MSPRKRKPLDKLGTTTPGGLIRRNVYLPRELVEQLQALSERLYRPESDLIREAVREYLARSQKGE
jgi:metal-responsive CopG/Arc/MetJ family transcriptional regulator